MFIHPFREAYEPKYELSTEESMQYWFDKVQEEVWLIDFNLHIIDYPEVDWVGYYFQEKTPEECVEIFKNYLDIIEQNYVELLYHNP